MTSSNYKFAIGVRNNNNTITFAYLCDTVYFYSLANALKYYHSSSSIVNALKVGFLDRYMLCTDNSSRINDDSQLVCNNKYHYVNHVKKWSNADIILLFQKGEWHINDTTFMDFNKWHSLKTYLKRNYYEYHNARLSLINGYTSDIYEVVSYGKTRFFEKSDLYYFLKNNEVKTINFEKVNDDIHKNGRAFISNTHNRKIMIKPVSNFYIIRALYNSIK